MRSRSRTVHVRCQLHPALADDIYAYLRGVFGASVARLARDFQVTWSTMSQALKMASKRARERGECHRRCCAPELYMHPCAMNLPIDVHVPRAAA